MQRIGKYEILGELGKGAMGVVRKARDPLLDRVVALKTMFGGASSDPEAKERFLREARSAARLQHPNIITIYEMGEVDGVPFIAMELLEGRNLADERASGGLMELRDQLVIADQLCRGLHYAHQRGVVHRDVKPTNIFVQPDGMAKLLDFGIARLEGGTFATRTGVVLGTPHYMAPEQFTGDEVDFRVDMWAVGVILYEMITGTRPVEAKSVPALIYQLVHGELPKMDATAMGVTQTVVAVLRRALARKPDQRFASMDDMGSALRVALGELMSRNAQSGRPGPALDEGSGSFSITTALNVRDSTVVHAPPSPAVVFGAPAQDRPAPSLSARSFRDQVSFGDREGLAMAAVAPDEQVLAVGGVDGSIRLWDLSTRMKLSTFRSRIHLRTGHAARTTALAFSPDSALLASGHLDGSVYLWDLGTGFELEARMRHEGAVHGLVFAMDGSLLISAGSDATLKYWELEAVAAGEARRQLRRQPAECTALAISRDGRAVISAHANRSLRVHELPSGRLLATLHGHRSAPGVLAVSQHDDLVLSGSRNGTVRLFRFDTRVQLRSFAGHVRTVSSLCFLPDGRHFVSVAMDRALVVWKLSSSEPLTTLLAHSDEAIASVSCLRGSKLLLGGLADGRFRVWSFDAEAESPRR